MRTKDLKIDGQIVNGVLQAGGAGARIYFIDGNRYAIEKGRKLTVISKDDPRYKTVAHYATLPYQNISDKPKMIADFDTLVKSLGESMTLVDAINKELDILEADDNAELKDKIVQFFKDNPNPNDDQIHDFAEKEGMSPHDVETMIYSMLTDKIQGEALTEDMSVANEILRQLGGNKFIAMTGAKNIAGGDNYISMKLGSGTKNGITHFKVELDQAHDSYNMYFYKVRGSTMTTVKEYKNIYVDNMKDLFTKETGFDTHL